MARKRDGARSPQGKPAWRLVSAMARRAQTRAQSREHPMHGRRSPEGPPSPARKMEALLVKNRPLWPRWRPRVKYSFHGFGRNARGKTPFCRNISKWPGKGLCAPRACRAEGAARAWPQRRCRPSGSVRRAGGGRRGGWATGFRPAAAGAGVQSPGAHRCFCCGLSVSLHMVPFQHPVAVRLRLPGQQRGFPGREGKTTER